MNIKTIAMTATMCGTVTLSAATVENVLVRQQWPWSPKVNVDYVLRNPKGGLHDVKLVLSNGTEEVATVFGSVDPSTSIGVEVGENKLVWDPQHGSPAYPKVLTDLTATVTAEDNDKMFMILDISGGSAASSYPVTFTNRPPATGWVGNVWDYRTTKIVFRRIPAGTFVMGLTDGEKEHFAWTSKYSNDWWKRRTVTLTKPYYIALFPTTLNQHWLLDGGTKPASGTARPYKASRSPTYASLRGANAWDRSVWPNQEADSLLGRLNAKMRTTIDAVLPGYRFELPTHAQWENACRGGTDTCYNNGKDWAPGSSNTSDANLDPIATYTGGAWNNVGLKLPNRFGLYDMHGGVSEMIRDAMSSWSGIAHGVADHETDPLCFGTNATANCSAAWGCGGRANGGASECPSGFAQMISNAISDNNNITDYAGYRLALTCD